MQKSYVKICTIVAIMLFAMFSVTAFAEVKTEEVFNLSDTRNMAPVLILPDINVVGETFNLTGTTEADCTLTINDIPVTVNADGTFTQTLTLTDGKNEFVVKATDKAGNATTQQIVINKAADWSIIIGGFGAVITFAISLAINCFNRKIR